MSTENNPPADNISGSYRWPRPGIPETLYQFTALHTQGTSEASLGPPRCWLGWVPAVAISVAVGGGPTLPSGGEGGPDLEDLVVAVDDVLGVTYQCAQQCGVSRSAVLFSDLARSVEQ